jgi:hypothetical protein
MLMYHPVVMQPKGINLGQAVVRPLPPEPVPSAPASEPFDPKILVIPAAILAAVVLYAMFGHKKMTWDKLFY